MYGISTCSAFDFEHVDGVPNCLCRWGNTLSTKMFVAKDFVLKHIKGKHSAKVAEARQQVS